MGRPCGHGWPLHARGPGRGWRHRPRWGHQRGGGPLSAAAGPMAWPLGGRGSPDPRPVSASARGPRPNSRRLCRQSAIEPGAAWSRFEDEDAGVACDGACGGVGRGRPGVCRGPEGEDLGAVLLATEATARDAVWTSKPTSSVLNWRMADLRGCEPGCDLRRLWLPVMRTRVCGGQPTPRKS